MASATDLARGVKLLLDEMHAPSVADALSEQSFDVAAVAAEVELRGMPDDEVLAYAAAAERALVTENVIDYVPLAEQWATDGRTHAGLIFTNAKRFNRATIAYPGNLITALKRFLDHPPIHGESWMWWV